MTAAEPPGMAEFRRNRRAVFYPKTDLPYSPEGVRQLLQRKRELLAQFTPLIQERSEIIFGSAAEAVEPCPELGTFHSIYKIRARGEEWYLRADMLGIFGRAYDLLVDQQLAQLLASREFPAVRVFGTDLDRIVLPFDFQVTHAAPGRPVKALEDPETQALPEELLEEMGRRMAQVHRWNAAGAGLLDAYYPLSGVQERWSDYILLRLAEHTQKCEEIGAISVEEHSRILELFGSAAPLLKSAPIKLLHGDWGHHNIFVEGNQVVAVIDWEDALAGDPVFDMAYWGTFVRAEMTGPFTRGYLSESQDSWPEDFEIRYWLYYLRIALSKTVHRHLFGIKDRPSRPPASRRIQTALMELQEVWG